MTTSKHIATANQLVIAMVLAALIAGFGGVQIGQALQTTVQKQVLATRVHNFACVMQSLDEISFGNLDNVDVAQRKLIVRRFHYYTGLVTRLPPDEFRDVIEAMPSTRQPVQCDVPIQAQEQ